MATNPLADVADVADAVTAGTELDLELLVDHARAASKLVDIEPATLPPPVVPEEEDHAGLTDAERLMDLVSKAKCLDVLEKYAMVAPKEEDHDGLTDAERLINLVSKVKGLHELKKYTMVKVRPCTCCLSRLAGFRHRKRN